jgi:hypothetical protein
MALSRKVIKPLLSVNIPMLNSVIKETFYVTEALLKQESLKERKPMPLKTWLDPSRYPLVDNLNLEDVSEYLPAIYKPFIGMTNDLPWRTVITQAVLHNEKVDIRMENWMAEYRMPVEIKGDEFYSVPLDQEIARLKLGQAPQQTLWNVYLMPLIFQKREITKIPIKDIERRKLDFRELFSKKYEKMPPNQNPPPGIIAHKREMDNGQQKEFTLIEGHYRLAKADEEGWSTFPCKIFTWQEIVPFINVQPIKGSYRYEHKS